MRDCTALGPAEDAITWSQYTVLHGQVVDGSHALVLTGTLHEGYITTTHALRDVRVVEPVYDHRGSDPVDDAAGHCGFSSKKNHRDAGS